VPSYVFYPLTLFHNQEETNETESYPNDFYDKNHKFEGEGGVHISKNNPSTLQFFSKMKS
jgi:hypothetical protein